MFNSRGNPLFRSGDRGSFWRSSVVTGSATFDDEDDDDDEEDDNAAGAGTRAVELATNGSASAPTAAATDAEANGRAAGRLPSRGGGGNSSLDASERGEGGGDASSTSGRILFYHKPTLANVPAGDVPDVVPVYLGCPRGNMALGLPLNEAWQGEEHQVWEGSKCRHFVSIFGVLYWLRRQPGSPFRRNERCFGEKTTR